MHEYQKEFARLLAESGALFFRKGLRLKDGRPSPYFANLGLFRTGRLIGQVGGHMARMIVDLNLAGKIDVVLGPSYKGSALAVATAQALWNEHGIDRAFEYDRKVPKGHGEATGGKNMFVTGALETGARVFIVDDVGTTMATKYDLLELLEAESETKGLSLEIVGVGLCLHREQTTAVRDESGNLLEGVRGEDALSRFTETTGIPVHYIVGIRQAADYLAEAGIPVSIDGERRPLDAATMQELRDYLAVYGVEPQTSDPTP